MNEFLSAFARLGASMADHWLFWLLLAAALVLVTICTLQFFKTPKRWVRALICGSLAIECVWFICAGYGA